MTDATHEYGDELTAEQRERMAGDALLEAVDGIENAAKADNEPVARNEKVSFPVKALVDIPHSPSRSPSSLPATPCPTCGRSLAAFLTLDELFELHAYSRTNCVHCGLTDWPRPVDDSKATEGISTV